ncbi:M56 family metallopeptidase [uncultured Sneathiella sp.]|jgi:beta-lactamase regulating signal transducer with metallopeptidase domain|uniref:M56 family metallopeptidase n=1 Tax=uncultured Sneathiella sp. TaxID=879315 RepID=UPI0030DC00F1|tara:strand:- start:10812 stop:11915 length:1104 start_codon:yes stop_codon:yes gene_type:complete
MTPETVLNVFIDANILLLVACLVWTAVLAIFPFIGLRGTFRTQLFLLNGSIGTIILCPIFVYLFSGWTSQHSLNISDLVVSNYLNGNFHMDAVRLELALGFREEIVREITSLKSLTAQILVGTFAAISAALFFRLLCQGRRLLAQLNDSYLLKRIGNVYILVSDEVSVPYSTRGLTRRYIVIPEETLTRQLDLKIAITHELQHFRQKDIEWEFFLEALKPLFFWNPVYYIWCAQVRRLREYACDQTIVNRSSYGIRAYCECLLRASRSQAKSNLSRRTRLPSVALVDMCDSEKSKRSLLRKRILMMTNEHGNKGSKLVSALASISVFGIVFTTSVLMQNPKDWSHDRLMLSTIINLERMNTINRVSR